LASEEETFKEGSYFGEDALVGAELLHDAIHASTQSSVMALSREDFLLLLQHNLPLYISVLKGLVLQIKQATITRKTQPATQEQALKSESSKSDSLIEQEMLMQNCGLFAGLNRATLQQLLIGSNIKQLEAGAVLYEPGEAGIKLYLVASGEIELCLNGEVKLRLGRGGSFGKYSYLGSSLTTPTQARTSQPTTVIEIDGESIDGTLWSNRERIEMTVGYLYEQKQSLMPELTEFTWF
jgi:CRP-like cAMP-binding protein